MNAHKTFKLILAFVFIFSLLGMPAPASAQEPTPYIQANPVSDWVRVYDWPLDDPLTLTINNGERTFYPVVGWDPFDNSQTRTYIDLNGFDLKPGDILKVSDGITELIYTPTNLAFTGFDLAAHTISGIGTSGEEVGVGLNTPDNCPPQYVTPASNGKWTVSFSGVCDEDLVAGSNGGLVQPSQRGNQTFVTWQIPSIEADLSHDQVIVHFWPLGSSLTLTINNNADNKFYATVGLDPNNNSGTLSSFDLGDFDLKAGDLIKVTDDSTPPNELTYTPTNLAFTDFNLAAHSISGIGTPGVEGEVFLNTPNNSITLPFTPAENGIWTVYFSGTGDGDLVAGSNGGLSQPNQRGNQTFVNWQIPGIEADLSHDQVIVHFWPLGSSLTLTINNNADNKFYATVGLDPWDNIQTIASFDLGGFDLKAGDNLKVTDTAAPPNVITYTPTDLALTGFNLDKDTLSGIGTPGVELEIMFNPPNSIRRSVIPDSYGKWTLSLSGFGDEDLVASSNGGLSQPSQRGNSTFVTWQLPRIIAFLTGNLVRVDNWPVGSSLTLTINDVNTFQATVVMDPGGDRSQTRAFFDLNGFDLKAGDHLKVTDIATPPSQLTYTPTNLALTGFDLAANTISGTGAPGAEVGVYLITRDNSYWNFVTPDFDGNWTIKFSGVGDEYLVPGSNGWLRQGTPDGVTIFEWEIPNIVTNRPPQITNISVPNIPIQIGQSINATATFLDPDLNDTHAAVWDWGDDLTSPGIVNETSQIVSGSHTYLNTGVYTVTLTLTDAAGETASAISEYVVIYDPSAGFVTGGGWITSPAGAYTADPSLTGKATFGFVSKYKKGASVPTGNTEFQFKVGNLNFSSTAYDWLVVAGAKAQYKGTGTINGTGSYRFMLTATDGQINGGGGVDKFRIKIWDATGQVVYDNQQGAGDVADPTTAIQGGSIVIHK